jgi:hypothetical protein
VGYAALLVLSFLPQSLSPADTIAYVGDSLESVYIVAWNAHQLAADPVHLFDANVLHPHDRALAFTDHRLLPSAAVAPVVWATGNPVLAYNLAVALACLVAAFAARRVARLLGMEGWAAWAAGALYAFHTYQVNEAPRLNIIAHGFIPLALGELLLLLRTGERRRAWTTAGCLLLQGLSSNYHLLYGVLLLGFTSLVALVARARLVGPRFARLVVPGGVAALLYLPVAAPYLELARSHGLRRDLPAGIDLEHYVSTSPTNWLYGAIGAEVRLQQRGPHFVGFVALILSALALLALLGRTDDPPGALLPARVWVPAAAAMSLLLVALSLGRDVTVFGRPIGPGPYRLLYDWVPGFRLVRIPERLGLLAMLFVALLVARALTVVSASRLRPAAAGLALLVPLEHLSPLPVHETVPVGDRIPAVYRWLATSNANAVAEVPVRGEGLVREETLEMYFSTTHWQRLIHGYTAYPPLLTRILRRAAAQFPGEGSLQALQRVGVDTVVVHHGRALGTDLLNQIPGRDDVGKRAEHERRLRLAGLDLYPRLPAAVAAGRLRREARFEGPGARLQDSTADEVYRILPAPPLAPAPFPSGRRHRGAAWRYRTKLGDPAPAADADPRTAWVVARSLLGDEFYEITFDRPVAVAGVVLPLQWDSVFPTRFRIGGRDGEGRWLEVARFDDAHLMQLVDRLLTDEPAALGFDLGGRELTGVSLLVEEGGTSFDGWRLPEVEVWVP